MPERGNNELSNDHKRPGSAESPKLAQEALASSKPFWETTEFKQGSSEFVGTAAAGLAGILTFSAGWTNKSGAILKAASFCVAPIVGGVSKHTAKEGMDQWLSLKGKNRTASDNDYWTGALDAFAGISGSAAEKKVSHWYTGYLGRKELGRGSAPAAGGLKHEFSSWLKGKAPNALVSDKCAIKEGERIVSQDILPQITHNILRGTAGGYAGSLTWSIPHRITENAQTIQDDPAKGTLNTVSSIASDTAIGTLFGGGTAGLITTALSGRRIARYLHANAAGDEHLTRLDVAYFNDAHSQTLGERNFARASTKIKDIRKASQALDNSSAEGQVCWEDVPESERTGEWFKQFIGASPVMKDKRSYRNDHFYENGDLENANITSSFTGWGKLEDKVIREMGAVESRLDDLLRDERLSRVGVGDLQVQPPRAHVDVTDADDFIKKYLGITSQTDGNHWSDQAGGGANTSSRPNFIFEANKQSGVKRPIVVANHDYSDLPLETQEKLKEIVRPYLVHTLKGPGGKDVKAATIGMVTEEGAVGGIKYQNPLPWVEELANGRKIQHPGRVAEVIADIKKEHPDLNIFILQSHLGDEIDRQIAKANKDLSVIFGAHSHKAFGTPVWVNNGERDIAILQAGSYLSHVGEANLAFNPNGSLNRYHTTGKLHAITSKIEEDPAITDIVAKNTPKELEELRNKTYDSRSITKYSIETARTGENATANLWVNAQLEYLNRVMPELKGRVIVGAQGGSLRAPIPANQELSRFDIAKLPINSGIKANEELEQVLVQIPGYKYIEALEFGCADLNPPKGFFEQMLNRFKTGKDLPNTDDPQGNLLHYNGSYTMNLSKPVGQRTSNHKLFQDGQLVPLEPNETYPWLIRWHYIEKLHKAGLFDSLSADGCPMSLEDAHKLLRAQAYKHSIVDAIADYIKDKTLDPKVHGKVEGRIIDATPQPFSLQYGPGPSIPTFSLLSARDTMSGDQKAH